MNELKVMKWELIEKSIENINKLLDAIDRTDMVYAADIYNTVLIGFEYLLENIEKDEGNKSIVDKYLVELEKEHKKIIAIFEKGSFKSLSSAIKKDILKRYISINEYYKEEESLSKNNMSNNSADYKRFKVAGLLKEVDQEVIEKIQNYWEESYKKKIDPTLHLAYYNLTGKVEPRIISQVVFNTDILPILNEPEYYNFYSDKNVYDLFINADSSPEVVLKRVYNQYFDSDNNTISRGDAIEIFLKMKEDLIIKESTSDDGKSVEKIEHRKCAFYFNSKKVDLKYIEDNWGKNFIIQKVLKQHPLMAKPHKYSVNTFRMITLRWNNKINYLMTFAKFGADKEIKDNSGGSAMAVSVSPEGEFSDWGMDYLGNIHESHPTTGYEFKDLEKIPNFDEYISFVKKLHNRILHNDWVCWDIAMGLDGKPIFIEMNFRGGVWKYQLVPEKPIFGDFTEEILAKAVKARNEREKEEKETSEIKEMIKERDEKQKELSEIREKKDKRNYERT